MSLNPNQYICKCCAWAEEPSLLTGFIGSTRVTYCSSRACQHGYMAFGLKLVTKNTGCAGIRQWRQAWGAHVWEAEVLAWKYDYLQANGKVQFVSVLLWAFYHMAEIYWENLWTRQISNNRISPANALPCPVTIVLLQSRVTVLFLFPLFF